MLCMLHMFRPAGLNNFTMLTHHSNCLNIVLNQTFPFWLYSLYTTANSDVWSLTLIDSLPNQSTKKHKLQSIKARRNINMGDLKVSNSLIFMSSEIHVIIDIRKLYSDVIVHLGLCSFDFLLPQFVCKTASLTSRCFFNRLSFSETFLEVYLIFW